MLLLNTELRTDAEVAGAVGRHHSRHITPHVSISWEERTVLSTVLLVLKTVLLLTALLEASSGDGRACALASSSGDADAVGGAGEIAAGAR
jgi:hypothetical protein